MVERTRSRRAVELTLAMLVLGCPLACVVAGLADRAGPWVFAVVALLVVAVAWLKWREVRARRAERRVEDAIHDLYEDALDRAGRGDHAGAAARFEEAIGRGDHLAFDLHEGLAAAHLALGDTGRAVGVWRGLYERNLRDLGEDALPTVAAANGLAAALLTHGERTAAGDRYRDTLDRCRRLLGDAHPETVAALNGVTRTDPDPRHGQVAALYEELFGPSHPDTTMARRQAAPDDPATARLAAGDLMGARTQYERAGQTSELAMVLREQRDLIGAHGAYVRAAERTDPRDPAHVAALAGLARVMLLQGDDTNAAVQLAAVVEACVALYGADHPETVAAARLRDLRSR
ncbi:tetratricopeptide repeat protein [Dactylosporangium sp. NPDC005555]|uniref:tetratricopeptide repeat protein n=1 Tax=Dactylosporangium sp. NPDC005555 TaxID=3154889 RepID=UPI0033BE813D